MPCSDITEFIKVTVDQNDRLKDYALAKRSCGRAVGTVSFLIDRLGGLPLEVILSYDADTFLERFPVNDDVEAFIALKHLFALQSALEVLSGREPGGLDDVCTAAEIDYEGDLITIEAYIALDVVTSRIVACGRCKGCAGASNA